MKHTRIILLGPTGISKSVALEKLNASAEQQLGRPMEIIDFEKELMLETSLFNTWPGFLRGDHSFQKYVWREAWKIFRGRLEGRQSAEIPLILSMHASYVRGDEGVRSVLDLHSICNDFQPTLIITLIDDVYNMWWRTEHRAQGEEHKGRPTLEQLIIARRSEVTIGDLITCQQSLEYRSRHVLFSVNHPVDVLLEIILFDAPIVYLSFPISAPRDLIRDSQDESFYLAINDFHQRVLRKFSSQPRPKKAFVSPLAIDELPLRTSIEDAISSGENDDIEFDPTTVRWPLADLWQGATLLSDIAPPRIPIPIEQAKDVSGLIRTDVGWRDYKLVRQAASLGIFCPKPPNRDRFSRGVEAELLAAIQSGGDKAIYIWQNPDWDTTDIVARQVGGSGSMGSDPIQTATTLVNDVDELVNRILS